VGSGRQRHSAGWQAGPTWQWLGAQRASGVRLAVARAGARAALLAGPQTAQLGREARRGGGGRLGLGQKREGKEREKYLFFLQTEILNYFANQFPNHF